MSDQPPQDPYGQDPYGQQQPQAYGPQGYPQGYGQQPYSGGYPTQPRQPLDLAKIVSIAAWVVLALFALKYLYVLAEDDFGEKFANRFFDHMTELGVGIFYSGVLHAVALWMEKQKGSAT